MNKPKLLLCFFSSMIFTPLAMAQPGEGPSMKELTMRSAMLEKALDLDNDGQFSSAEISAATASLLALDKNKDGILTADESHGGTMPLPDWVRTNWTFCVVDDDGDLLISAEEISEAPRMLAFMDKDKDGVVGANELRPPTPPTPPNPDPAANAERARFAAMMDRLNLYRPDENAGPLVPGSDSRAYDGYIFSYGADAMSRRAVQPKAWLMDGKTGEFVHEWDSEHYVPEGSNAYLLENGILVRAVAKHHWAELSVFPVGANGTIEMVDWDGNVIWSFDHCDLEKYCLHHDFEVMPNGNILAISYDISSYDEAEEFGWERKEVRLGKIFTESIIEIEPDLENGGGRIVWQWDSRDHVGKGRGEMDPNYDRIQRLFVGGQLFHFNSVDYNPTVDQIMVSSAIFGEIMIIDHNTTTEEAKGSKGDFLYRWGNPRTYGAGGDDETMLWWQHDAKWIDDAGTIMVFNNGGSRDKDGNHNPRERFLGYFDGAWSDVPVVELPMNADGSYDWEAETVMQQHVNGKAEMEFFSPFMSGAELLPNGNMIMVQAHDNRIVELLPDGTPVLDFQLPLPGRTFRIAKFSPDYPGISQLSSGQ